MPIKIVSIQKKSIADDSYLQPDDLIIRINGHRIEDFLDFQYYAADEVIQLEIRKTSGKVEKIEIQQDWNKPLGIEVEHPHCRKCINDCIFCFVSQMKPDLRKSLYLKDGDYRFSFVYGNFITLTNLTAKDFQKIVEQKLSPLYISVHTTNPLLHKEMLRYKRDFNILGRLNFLSQNGIELHTQIVVVPQWNDGIELERTLADLSNKNLNIASIGIVPVGLTKYRNSLPKLHSVDSRQARAIMEIARPVPNTYCSDEIFLLAGEKIPEKEYYDDFPQLENGIGMIRLLLENWQESRDKFFDWIERFPQNLVFITGKSAEQTITLIAAEINRKIPQKVRVQPVLNHFFGESVTVSGLLCAADILSQTNLTEHEIPVFSSNLFNQDGLTLDDISQYELKKKFNAKHLFIVDEQFADWEGV